MTKIETIPVAKPKLIGHEKLIPYLQEIDESRIYSNFGPLCQKFETRLCQHYGISESGVVLLANATLGLTASLLAVRRQQGSVCILPSWTFCASAHAVLAAGLEPHFVDVDPATWQITPSMIERLPPSLLNRLGAVMPVGAFGAPVDGIAWDCFSERTGIPVVIDAAAGFDSLVPSRTPAIVSLHATKALGVGEGGFVTTIDPKLAETIRQRANFGFRDRRSAELPSLNAKLSEYACAIGLASLDAWPETRSGWAKLRDLYRFELASAAPEWFSDASPQNWVSSTFVLCTTSPSMLLSIALASVQIDSRRWWESGCKNEPAFADCASEPMPVTDYLAQHSIGLPFAIDMTEQDVKRVISEIKLFCHPSQSSKISVYPEGDTLA